MASKQDDYNRRFGNDESQISNNHNIAMAQGEKTSFRAHQVALSADKYNPARLSNAVQQKMKDT